VAIVDDLDAVDALVVDGLTPADDGRLAWFRRAPCVVVATDPAGSVALAAPDVVVSEDHLDDVLAGIDGAPRAALALVHVLRIVGSLPVADGLVVESLAYSALLGSSEFEAWLGAQPDRPPRSFASPPVRVERTDTTLQVTLSRPENRNAFSAELRDGLVEALLAAEVDPTIERVVLRAEGPCFSSGGDLTEFGSGVDLARAHQIRTLRSPGLAIDRLGDRVEVHVQGPCVGAGVELPAFASHVVAAPGTTFRLPEVAMGLIPGAGGTVSVTHRIGRHRTADLALSGRTLCVDEALAIGLVDEVGG
jgi:hypothetical protein